MRSNEETDHLIRRLEKDKKQIEDRLHNLHEMQRLRAKAEEYNPKPEPDNG